MIELQKTVKQLREIRRYYAVKINEIGGSLVFITLPDFNAINLNLSNLIKQVKYIVKSSKSAFEYTN